MFHLWQFWWFLGPIFKIQFVGWSSNIETFFQFLNTVDLNLFLSKCHNPHWNVECKHNRWYLQWIPRRQPSRNRPSGWTSCNNWCRNPTEITSQKYCWPVKIYIIIDILDLELKIRTSIKHPPLSKLSNLKVKSSTYRWIGVVWVP